MKTNISILISLCLIMGGLFFYIWPNIKFVTLIYDYNNLRVEQKELSEYNRLLQLELASIKSLEKVERRAIEEMGMIVPEDNNIILVQVKN